MNIKNFFKIYKGLPKSIYVLFGVRIINALGAFVGPFLTIFLSKNIGLSKEVIGTFVSINSLSSIPGSLIGGKITDSFGRKKTLIVFQGLAALCYLPCAFLGSSIIIPFILILATFFNSIASPAYGAMIADLTNVENRNSSYSLLYLGANIGFAFGPMIAGFLYYSHYIKAMFIGNSAAVLCTLTIIYTFIRESKPKKENELSVKNDFEKPVKTNLVQALLDRPLLLIFAFLSIIYGFVYSQYPYCIPLQVEGIFKNNYSLVYSKIMATNGVTVIVFTTVITRLTKKLSAIQNVSLAGLFYACGFGMLFFVKTYPMFIVSTVIWTIGEILQSTNAGVYIANHTPMSHRGRFNAVIPIITGLGSSLGPAIMGGYIKNRNVIAAWPVAFIAAIAASVLFYILYRTEKKKESICCKV